MLADELNNALKFTINYNLGWERPKFENIVKTTDSLFHGHFRKKQKTTEETKLIRKVLSSLRHRGKNEEC